MAEQSPHHPKVNGSCPANGIVHGQTSAKRLKPGLSFQLLAWECFYMLCNRIHDKIAKLKAENWAQTTIRLSPVSFCTPRIVTVLGKFKKVLMQKFMLKFLLFQNRTKHSKEEVLISISIFSSISISISISTLSSISIVSSIFSSISILSSIGILSYPVSVSYTVLV